jgi:DNA helicase-2/ATP-dependent DNA helicase PcrA
MSLYERIGSIMQADSSCLMVMNKSFRCTKEILAFSMRFLDGGAPFESFNRSGDAPQIIGAADAASLDQKIIEEAVYSKGRGYRSIAIICKDAKQAAALYERLQDKIDLHLVRSDGSPDISGVFVIPVIMSKGLEFDSVLIYGADYQRYRSDDDRKLLYIAGTRALHRLNIFYAGEISPCLKGEGV